MPDEKPPLTIEERRRRYCERFVDGTVSIQPPGKPPLEPDWRGVPPPKREE